MPLLIPLTYCKSPLRSNINVYFINLFYFEPTTLVQVASIVLSPLSRYPPIIVFHYPVLFLCNNIKVSSGINGLSRSSVAWARSGSCTFSTERPRAVWERAGPVPTAASSSSASILPWSRERGAARSAHTERQKMDGVGSFGAGRSGSTIDPITFAKQPQTILRVLSWVRASFHGAAVCVCAGGWGGPLCCRCCAKPVTCFPCKYRLEKSTKS